MIQFFSQFNTKISSVFPKNIRYGYIQSPLHSRVHNKPGLTAKRIIKCISQRLNKFDPERWNGVPFSFNTHWRDQGGYMDVQTAIQVHQALQHQFGIDIKDRHVLIQDIQMAFYIVNQTHESI